MSIATFQTAPPSSARKIKASRVASSLSFSRSENDDDEVISSFSSEHSPSLEMLGTRRRMAVGQFDQYTSRNAQPPSSRRSFLSLLAFAATATAPTFFNPNAPILLQQSPANAAETIGKDPLCNSPSCLGVWDGLLADCPHDKNILRGGAGCVSSQDDTPGIFAEPWDYSENIPLSSGSAENGYENQMDKLILALETTSKQHGDSVEIVLQEGRYLRALFADGSSGEKSVGEFYFTPNDTTVQFRIGSAKPSTSASMASSIMGRSWSNSERGEQLRKSMGYLKVPVLRNRKRAFFFVESDELDGFGPGSAMLGPPEEMSPGEVAGPGGGRTARGSEDADPKMRIDWTESFPLGGSR